MNRTKIQPGEYTIINLEARPYRMEGDVSFFAVRKVGRKYAHGQYIWFDVDEKRLGYETKLQMDHYQFIEGIHGDIRNLSIQFRRDLEKWKEKKKRRRYDLDGQARKWVWDQIEDWEKENPRPENPTKGGVKIHDKTWTFY